MRTKYPHAFSLDRCQFPSGSVATPSGHAHFAAVVLQGYACSVYPVPVVFVGFGC